ncbi:UBP-type zinc finger domain-containing protein [Gordonia sp. PKS22-38]|uniref:UBP-type zinc finger domain-containing protein n=1 Tax=Gordonia prachuapensis TaxID=3115651 RepID=A0ABU7MZV8_9ACTN|nr:UBP-type zinc finger domain-containing protein [Gordonia sp. PKS22-38]
MSDQFIDTTVQPSGTGCLECDTSGSWWFHLRRCAECGHIGCCDDSLNRHARAHAAATGHLVIQSYEPGEDWYWNFGTEELFAGPALAEPTARPREQGAPGPAERLPADWREQLRNR